MNDGRPQDDSLQAAIDALRAPVSIAPGLADRIARSRRARSIRSRAAAAGVLVIALLIGVLKLLPFAGAESAVTFALDAPEGRSVSLVGDFTDWQPGRVRLTQSHDGKWKVTLHLQPGRYRFAYVVDDRDWRPDGRAAMVADDFGRPTSVLTVAAR